MAIPRKNDAVVINTKLNANSTMLNIKQYYTYEIIK